MNWQMVAALVAAFGSVIGIATTIFCVAYFAGKLTQRIDDTQKVVDEHDLTLKDHSERLSDHEVKIAQLNAWREGYNAAVAITHKAEESNG